MIRLRKSLATVSTALVLLIPGTKAQTAANSAATHPATDVSKPVKPKAAAQAKTPEPNPAATSPATDVSKPAKPKAGAQAKTTAPKPPTGQRAATKPAVSKPGAAKPAAPKTAQTAPAPKPGVTASPDQALVLEKPGLRRDPFVALVNDRRESASLVLPPGKAGLVVATVRVDGTVKSGLDLIAVVSNPERHVYFVREGDQLYDGTVQKIDLDGVTFHENSKDAFGKPVVREVTKRIYASVGEQQ